MSSKSVPAVGRLLPVETLDHPSLTGPRVVPQSVDPVRSKSLVPHPNDPRATTSDRKSPALENGSRIFNLIAGTARVSVSASVLVAGEVASRSVKLVRVVLPAGVPKGPLDAIERQVRRGQDEARRNEQESLDDVTKAAKSVLNRVVVEVVDMLDMEQLIDHVPINRVVARIDLPEVIDEIDLAGIVREGTRGLGGETLDYARGGLMAMDQWSARLVDKILRRKEPRDLIMTWDGHERPETATAEVLE